MSISNGLINILVKFTSTLNGLPSGMEFEMAALDDDFESKTQEFNKQISDLAFQTIDFVNKKEDATHDVADIENECHKTINMLLNDPIMNVLDQKLAAIESSSLVKVNKTPFGTPVLESKEINGVTFLFTKNEFPRPDKFIPKITPPESIPFVEAIPDFGSIYEKAAAFTAAELTYVDTPDALYTAMAKMSKDSVLFISTEIHRVRTYRPFPCFISILSPSIGVYVFDLLKLRFEVASFNMVLANKNVIKVFYDKDILQLFVESLGIFIAPAIDLSLVFPHKTVEDCIIANDEFIHKCIVDWRIRPVAKEMKVIAAESVLHLPKLASIAPFNEESLEKMKQLADISAEPYVFTNEDADVMTGEAILDYGDLDESGVRLLSELIVWRDGVAQLEDQSPNFIISTKLLWNIASTKPSNYEQLQRCMSESKAPFRDTYRDEILSLVGKASSGGETRLSAIKEKIVKE